MSDFAPATEIAAARDALTRLAANMRQTIKGKDEVIDQTLVCLLAGGHLLIEDLQSTNGTYVNTERVVVPTRLRRGDIVQAGGTIMEVVR